MRRIAFALLALAPLAAVACSGGDDDAVAPIDSAAVNGPENTGSTTSVASSGSAPATTAPMPATDPARCEDVPAAADHPLGEVPIVLRPCAVPTELQVNVIHPGQGRPAEDGDTVIIDYSGVLADTGEMFDTSYLRGVPYDFVLGRGGVIAGWDVGLAGTAAGAVVKLDVPAAQAYGDTPPSDDIPAGAALTYMVEVRAVVPPVSAADAPLDLLVDPSNGATAVGVVEAVPGDGPAIERGQTAVVHMLLARGDDLSVLLNTWEQSDPLQIVMADGQSLPGVVTGLDGATVGSTRVITIPPEQAFGPNGEVGLGLPAGVDLIVVAQVMGAY